MIRGLAATSELVKVLRLQTKQLGPVTTRWLSQQQSDSGTSQSAWSDDDDNNTEYDGPPPEPPSPLVAVSALALGAFGAVGIAAVGVYSSFHFAAWAIAQNSQEKTEKRVESPDVE